MEIRHLKMIREVAAHGSLTLAAEHLYLSQSALSHQLKDIEAFFNTQIFIRQNKKMLLTDAGRIILEASDKILGEIEETKAKIKMLTEEDAGEVRISTECFTSYHWLSGFLSDFSRSYPQVEISIHPDATYQSAQYLLHNKIDLAILDNNDHPGFDHFPLFKDEFVAVVPNDHRWVGRKYVTPEMFCNEVYIMYNIPKEMSTVYQLLFANGSAKKVYRITLTEAIIQMVKAGLGVSALPNWIVSPYVASGELTAIPLTRKGLKRVWFAATLKNKVQPRFIHAFIEKLARHVQQSEGLSACEQLR